MLQIRALHPCTPNPSRVSTLLTGLPGILLGRATLLKERLENGSRQSVSSCLESGSPCSLHHRPRLMWDLGCRCSDLCPHLWRSETLFRASAAAWQWQVGMEHENTLRSEARSDSFSQSAGDIHLSTWQDFPSGITDHCDCVWRVYGSKIGEGGGEGGRWGWEIRSQATEIPEECSPLNKAVHFFS